MMTSPLYTLVFLGLFCGGRTSATPEERGKFEELDVKLADVETDVNSCTYRNCTVDDWLEHIEVLLQGLRDDIYDLRVDQEIVKRDLVIRVKAIEDTLVADLQAVETRIELILANHYRDFRPSRNFTDDNLPKVHTSCEAAFDAGWTRSGVYRVSPKGSSVVMDVYCEQDSELFGGGWTVFQRRQNGSVDFYRGWDQYKNGFGDLNGEFWLGNDNINRLTANRRQRLMVEVKLYGSGFAYAYYDAFWVNSESLKYQLHVSGFSAGDPNAGDSLIPHNEHYFTTKDRDNDDDASGNCAHEASGAWWYHNCRDSNLNGLYGSTESGKGINWHAWKANTISMSSVKMMIKENPSLLEHGNVDYN